MAGYTAADIFTDMVGEFPTEYEEIGVDIIRVAYSAYRQGLGNHWTAASSHAERQVEGWDDEAPMLYASYSENRCGHNEYAYVTAEWPDGRQQGFRVCFVAQVDNRHPENALAEEW